VSGDTPSVLARILQSTRAELERRKQQVTGAQLRERIADDARTAGAGQSSRDGAPRGFRAALTRPGIAVIAEFKRRSPSAGTLRDDADLATLLAAYERGGASGLSVLTEQPNFGGTLADLTAARGLVRLPVLRKDFIVDEYQLLEARAAGADAVLLIVAALDDEALASLHSAAGELALDVLVEVHDREEVARALDVGAELVGVNNRDLRDFSVDVGRTSRLRGTIPSGVAVVSESGIASAEQLRVLEGEGVDAVLVGETLMRAENPEQALRELTAFESETAAAP
jgi:indole-3-glycerol phosphate synthase